MTQNPYNSIPRHELVAAALELGIERPEQMSQERLGEAVRVASEQAEASAVATEEALRSQRPPPKASPQRGWFGVARHLVANVMEQGLNLPEAARVIRAVGATAERGAPRPPLPTVTLGQIYLAQGHSDKARVTLEQVLLRQPDNAKARSLLDRLAISPSTIASAPRPGLKKAGSGLGAGSVAAGSEAQSPSRISAQAEAPTEESVEAEAEAPPEPDEAEPKAHAVPQAWGPATRGTDESGLRVNAGAQADVSQQREQARDSTQNRLSNVTQETLVPPIPSAAPTLPTGAQRTDSGSPIAELAPLPPPSPAPEIEQPQVDSLGHPSRRAAQVQPDASLADDAESGAGEEPVQALGEVPVPESFEEPVADAVVDRASTASSVGAASSGRLSAPVLDWEGVDALVVLRDLGKNFVCWELSSSVAARAREGRVRIIVKLFHPGPLGVRSERFELSVRNPNGARAIIAEEATVIRAALQLDSPRGRRVLAVASEYRQGSPPELVWVARAGAEHREAAERAFAQLTEMGDQLRASEVTTLVPQPA